MTIYITELVPYGQNQRMVQLQLRRTDCDGWHSLPE